MTLAMILGSEAPPSHDASLGTLSSRRPSDHIETSSINRIPVEILGEIFKHYLRVEFVFGERKVSDGQASYTSFPIPTISTNPGFRTTPVPLTHVCGYWRGAALSMPTLWSSIAIHQPRTQNNTYMLILWLERSGTCPLSLFVNQHMRCNLEVLDDMLYLLTNQLDRWKEIDFAIRSPRPLLMNLPKGINSILESAVLDTSEWDYASVDQLWRSVHSCSTVRRAKWCSHYLRGGYPSHIPWNQLAHITLPFPLSAPAVSDILRMCHRIETLKITYDHSSSMPFDQCTPLLLPNLRVLHIMTNSDMVFELFTLPSLETLDLAYDFPPDLPRNPQPLSNFLVRSSCFLRSFAFMDVDISEDDLALYLALPMLRSVTVLKISADLTGKTIHSLTFRTWDDPAKPFFPRVESMSLGAYEAPVKVLCDMIESRINDITLQDHALAKLKSISILLNEDIGCDILRLKGIQGLAVNLSIRSMPIGIIGK